MRMVYVFPRTDLWKAALLSLLSIVMFSCSNELHMVFPEGPEGPAGKSAYEIWADEVNNGNIDWPKDRVDVNNFFLYLKGEDGKDGQDGQDGKSAYELWKEQVAEGLDNPKNPGTEWPKDETDLNDFWYYLTGADGKDGVTPNVGSNGNWWVNGEDTGIPAKGEDGKDGTDGEDGKDGEDGHTPVIEIKDGYWYIDGVNTGQVAQGPKGDKGDDGETGAAGGTGGMGDKGEPGKSAYDLWVEDVKDGGALRADGTTWTESMGTEVSDFWEFLTGPKGDDGEDGEDGKDGNDSGFQFVEGSYNVIAQYAHNEGGNQEYIAWNDGSVTYLVLNPKGEFVAEGTKVKLPQTRVAESAKDKEYTTEKNAQGASVVVVPYSDLLPNGENNINVAVGSSQVEEDGKFVETAKNTYVPVQMQVRLQFQVSDGVQLLKDGRIPSVMFYLRVQRKESDDSEWEALPTYITVDLTPMHWIHYVAADGQEAESGPYTPSNGPVRTQKYTYASDGGRPADRLIPIYFHRQFIKTEHTNNAVIEAGKGYGYYWGDNVTEKRYFRIGMTGLYGQTAMMDAWLQDLPAQFAPIVNDMTITRYDKISETRLDIISLKGSFQTDYIKDECLYTGYSKSGRVVTEDGLRAYEGVNEPEIIKNLAALNVTFSVGGQSVVLDQEVSLDSPDFVVSKRTVSLIKGEEYNVSFAWGGDYHNFYEISNEKPFTGNACHLKWNNDLDVWLIPGTYVYFEQFKLKYE